MSLLYQPSVCACSFVCVCVEQLELHVAVCTILCCYLNFVSFPSHAADHIMLSSYICLARGKTLSCTILDNKIL